MHSFRLTAAVALAALTLGMFSPYAQAQDRIEVPWAELAGALEGRKVSTVLVDGTLLQGRLLGVSPTEARFNVSKTSNSDLYPRGERAIPKAQLTTLSYRQMGGPKWRPIGTAIGAASGALATLPYWVTASGEGGLKGQNAAITLGGIGAIAALGYLLGHEGDKRLITVVVTKQ